jgi:hypothetical protein
MNSATSNAVSNRFGNPLSFARERSAGGCAESAVCADSVYVVFLIGASDHVAVSSVFDTWFSGLTNRVGMVRREDDRRKAIARAPDSVRLIQSAALPHARIVAAPERDAWRMCATHRTPICRAERHLVREGARNG